MALRRAQGETDRNLELHVDGANLDEVGAARAVGFRRSISEIGEVILVRIV